MKRAERCTTWPLKAVANAIIGAVNGPKVAGRFEQLEARIAALEQKPFVKFCGTWQRDTGYEAGAAVVHHSALWICKQATRGEPSKDFTSWQLAIKRGGAS